MKKNLFCRWIDGETAAKHNLYFFIIIFLATGLPVGIFLYDILPENILNRINVIRLNKITIFLITPPH
jgi:hypothetical protein